MQRVSILRHVASRHSQGIHARWLQARYATARPPPSPAHPLTGRKYIEKPAPSPPPASPPPPPPPANDFERWNGIPRWARAVMIAGATGFGLYAAWIVIAASKPCPNPAIKNLSEQKDVSGRYDDTADSFDAEVGMSEVLMGVNMIRKRLANQCKGHVLEVSCGTGRNLGYFDISDGGKVESLTFVDLSPQMVDVCRKKWNVLFGKRESSFWQTNLVKEGFVVRFLPVSALAQMPLAPTSPPRKYDTIIQTMGLCSTPHPTELLQNMVQHLDTSNPEARILLLEHGRSYAPWLNNILDVSAEKHAEIHGCWFNRDIGELVQEAAEKSGLEVVKERRWHLGTTWAFELKTKSVQRSAPVQPIETKPKTSWFGLK